MFHNVLSNPPVDVETTSAQATIRNLANVRALKPYFEGVLLQPRPDPDD